MTEGVEKKVPSFMMSDEARRLLIEGVPAIAQCWEDGLWADFGALTDSFTNNSYWDGSMNAAQSALRKKQRGEG